MMLTLALATLLVAGTAMLVGLMAVGKLTLDTGWGRTTHPLGPLTVRFEAPRELVFEQIASPYLGRTPASVRDKLEVIDRGEELVVAAHSTRVAFYTAVTVESVRFEAPERIHFRHLRGPVPHAVEEFHLIEDGDGTVLTYRGELGLDWWFLGRIAARLAVVPTWEKRVSESLAEAKSGAERRAAARAERRERG